MIAAIIAFCARRRWQTVLVAACLLAGGLYALRHIVLDAIPDLSDVQVIVHSRWDQPAEILEDQVTYPIVTGLLGTPRVKAVRGSTDFGNSFVTIVFEEGTDLYWARSRVLEQLARIIPTLPEAVRPQLGPDASSVGWAFSYALVDDSSRLNLAELRSLQDWLLKFSLQSVPGVAEVASLGGYVKQYQVKVDMARLQAFPHRVSIGRVAAAIAQSNREVGARVIERSGTEYVVRGRGYIRSKEDIENVYLGWGYLNRAVLVRDVAKVTLGSEMRRGATDLDGRGEAPGGIVVIRHGENALRVIERVKTRLAELQPSLPPGVRVVTTYDRSDLIHAAIATLKRALIEEMGLVSATIVVFLRHVPSALVPILTIPVAVLISFLPLFLLGVGCNIMSLSGIAISIGVLVDGAIVEVENAYRKLGRCLESGGADPEGVRLQALQEVGPSVSLALLVVAAAFLPVFALIDQEGRLFRPLAWSKTLTMLTAAVLTITLDPAVRMMFTRVTPASFSPEWLRRLFNAALVGRYRADRDDAPSQALSRLYGPAVDWVLERPKQTIGLTLLAMALTVPALFRLGSEFMPPLDEGTILYMPTTLPGISITEASRVLQLQNRILKGFPEVERVYGKAGRAETATDPAPLSMIETTVLLRPREQWRTRKVLGLWPRRLRYDELIAEMDAALRLPGVPNIWTQPIRNRIDMLATGMRSPLGVKILGSDLAEIERLSVAVEAALKEVPGTRHATAERAATGYYLDFAIRRQALAKWGQWIDDVAEVIRAAIGGVNATMTIEGRARYPVNVRYAPDFRDDLEKLKRVNIITTHGLLIPLSRLADIHMASGPTMIRDENGRLAGYVWIDLAGRDPGSYVAQARRVLAEKVALPPGYSIVFSGQYENMQRVREKLRVLVPLSLLLIVLLLYLNTGSGVATAIVLLAVPFSAIGAVWLLALLGYRLSVAVWVGIIALMGLDAETGIFMLMYLQLAHAAREAAGARTLADLKDAIREGAVGRLRPKAMTAACLLLGLLPILWSTGPGADMMKRVAAPMVGGLVTSFLMELLVYPALYLLWKRRDCR